MWDCKHQILNSRTHHYSVPLTYGQVITSWRDDSSFRTFFTKLLADSPFSAFRWETPPITRSTASRSFEFVLLDSPSLIRRPDPEAFGAHFQSEVNQSVLAFPNLGRDAILIVPAPAAPPAAYVHLASFLRSAPDHQHHDLWRTLASAIDSRLGSAPLWTSTAGMGVAWLHLRLDSHPKYYGHTPYTQPPTSS